MYQVNLNADIKLICTRYCILSPDSRYFSRSLNLQYWITLQRNIALHTVWLIFWCRCRYLGIPKLSLLVSQQTMIWANTSSVVLSSPWPRPLWTAVRNLDLGGLLGGWWPALTRVEHSELSQSLSLAQPPAPASSEGVAEPRPLLLWPPPLWYRDWV